MTDPRDADRRRRPPPGAKPPTEAYADLRRKYNLTRHDLSRALHTIKDKAGVPPDADTLVDAERNVYVASTGEGTTMGGGRLPEPDEARAVLVVLSETDSADDLAAAVGLPPDEAWNRGDVRKVSRLPYKYSGIEYCSRVPSTARPGDHLDDLLDRLAPVKERIAALAAHLAKQTGRGDLIRVSMLHMTSNGTPGYDFSPQQLLFVGELGAHLGLSVDFDPDAGRREA